MTALIIILAILLVLLIAALIRVGVLALYSDGEFGLDVFIGPYKLHIIPDEDKKPKKRKKKKADGKKKKHEDPVKELKSLLSGFDTVPKKLISRVVIDKLDIHFVSASEDPFNAAVAYGYASAAAGVLAAAVRNIFKVRKLDITTAVDFDAEESSVDMKARLSLAIWEIIVFSGIIKNMASGKNEKKSKTDNKQSEQKGTV